MFADSDPRPGSSVLDRLNGLESSVLLRLLLRQHPELAAEAQALAMDLLTRVEAESVAEDLEMAFHSIEQDDIWERSGSTRDGYVEPWEAAHEICEEVFEPFLEDLKRLLALGQEAAALAQAQGMLLGLHRVTGELPPDAEDYPSETAAYRVLKAWGETHPKAFKDPLLVWMAQALPEWAGHPGR